MAGHTPGPWTIDRWGGVIAPDGKRVLVDGVSLPTGNNPRIAEAEANARLVAAAPELLTACKAALARLDLPRPAVPPSRDDVLAMLRDAVARAEGRTA